LRISHLLTDLAKGTSGSKHIRRNLPLIMLVETFNYSLHADRIAEAMERAQARYPDEAESLVLESDLSAFPVTFSARPVREYGHMFDSRLQPAMLGELKGLPGKHILMAVKLKPALESFVVLSPRVALHLAFRWPPAGNEVHACTGRVRCSKRSFCAIFRSGPLVHALRDTS